jgi:hypothetical protein
VRLPRVARDDADFGSLGIRALVREALGFTEATSDFEETLGRELLIAEERQPALAHGRAHDFDRGVVRSEQPGAPSLGPEHLRRATGEEPLLDH